MRLRILMFFLVGLSYPLVLCSAGISEGLERHRETQAGDGRKIPVKDYTIQNGDWIYKIPRDKVLMEGRELHPSPNGDRLSPGQVIHLPLYRPVVVRKPSELLALQRNHERTGGGTASPETDSLVGHLKGIFSSMGENWVQSGKQYIPLRSGGRISLECESSPMIELRSAVSIILDLRNRLTAEQAGFIRSGCTTCRVVHLGAHDDVKSALSKILSVSGYPDVLKRGDVLKYKGEIPMRISGDWVLVMSLARSPGKPAVSVINLLERHAPRTPEVIKHYLETLGIKVIDFALEGEDLTEKVHKVEKVVTGGDPKTLIKALLMLTGHSFITDGEINWKQGKMDGMKLKGNVDFVVKIDGKNGLIDLTGFSPECMARLKEEEVPVLPLSAESDPFSMVAKTLAFLNFPFDAGPHSFLASAREETRNIRLILPGVVFADSRGRDVFAVPKDLPDDIVTFLSEIGYVVLDVRETGPLDSSPRHR